MNEELKEALLLEALEFINKPKFNVESFFDSDFPQQSNFIKDPARLKALFCTRRAAKSYTAGLYMVYEALTNPGCNCLFIGLTRASAKGIIWKDILQVINRKYDLGATFNISDGTMTLPNESVIWLTGVDTDEDEMNKLLGKKYRLVCLDEASMYTIDLHKLIYGILKPAVADNRGTICLMGTSSNFTRGLFFDITRKTEPGWSLHTWTANDNPHIKVQWAEELEDIRKNRPLFMETPLFKQWYLNEWVVDTNALVYKYSPERNSFSERPEHLNPNGWTYILGVDLGYEDDSAFVVGAYHDNDKILYIISTYNQKHMDITDVANKIKEFQAVYPIVKVIIDGANKQAVEEIQHRHVIALETADKTGKSDFIEILNAELIQGHVKINNRCSTLIDELMGLVWKTTGDKIDIPKREHPALPNHLCDAFLYMWRFTYQYMAEDPVKKLVVGTKEWNDKENENLFEKALEHFQQQKEQEMTDYW